MSAIDEKLVDVIWSSVDPILTIQRMITFIIFGLLISPYNEQLFSINVLTMKAGGVLELLQNAFKTIELWKLILALIITIAIAPFLTFKANQYLIKNIHIHNATMLINQSKLHSILKLTDLLSNRVKGIRKINFLKGLGEVISVCVIGMIYFITNLQTIGLKWSLIILFLSFAWLLAMYLNSQRILITFLTDIAPFNNAQQNK